MTIKRNTRVRVIEHDGYVCRYCGKDVIPNVGGPDRLALDHIFPKHHGGSDRYENLMVACGACNEEKGHKIPTPGSKWWLGTPGVKAVSEPQGPPRSKVRKPPESKVHLTRTIGDEFPELRIIATGHGLESKWLEGCDCGPCAQAHAQANGLRAIRRQPRVVR